MKQPIIDIKHFRLYGYSGVIIALSLLAAVIGLSYILMHNPHQQLHQQIFETADKIRNYYRDRPGYWKLSTETAREDNLISEKLQNHKEYNVRIGQGLDGDMGMPGDANFDIVLKNLNKSACINLSEMALTKKQELMLQKIAIVNEKGITEFEWGGDNPLPVVKYATRNICQTTDNALIWTFQ